MKFDVRAARALKAGEHLIIEDAPGLRLEASTTGRSFIYRYKSPIDARMRQVKIGAWPAMSAAEAGGEWERLRRAREAGRDPSLERRQERARPAPPTEVQAGTVGALVDGFVAWARERRVEKGANELDRLMRTQLDARFRAMRPQDVTRSVAYDLIQKLTGTPVQALNLRRELGAAWEWGHDAGRLDDSVPNWWRQILRGKIKSAGKIVGGEHQGVSKRALTADEVGAILRHLPHLSRLPAELLTLYLWTGCRGAELVQMEGTELAEVDKVLWWTIPKSKLKMGTHALAMDLPVPLIGRARDIVLARRDVHGAGHLFPSRSGRLPHVEQKVVGVAVWTHMPRCESRPSVIRARWPVENWSPHDLRRTVRTQLSRLGCPSQVAEAVLGHIDADEDVYDRHEYRAERLEWLTRLAETWEAACRR